MKGFVGLVALLIAVVLVSAIGVVYSTHLSRTHYTELRALEARRDALQVEWGRLQLEQSTWATHPRVEKMARERLGMGIPPQDRVVVISATGRE